MKKILLVLAFMLGGLVVSAHEILPVNENVNPTVITETVSDDVTVSVFGTCHIVISDRRSGEVLYEVSLPANTAEICEKMLAATLKAFNDGTLP